MSGYVFKTGRERQIRYYGEYSWDYTVSLDLTQSGLSRKVTKLYATSGGAFVGWGVAISTPRTSSCAAGFDADFSYPSPPGPAQLTFGPIIAANASTTNCIVDVSEFQTVIDSIDCGWDGTTIDDLTGGFWNPIGVNLYAWSGGIVTVTDTLTGTISGDWEFIADMEEVALWSYESGVEPSELEPVTDGIFPINRVQYSEVYKVGGSIGWNAGAYSDVETIADPYGYDIDLYYPWVTLNANAADSLTSTASLTATWDGGGYTQTPTSLSASGSYGSCTEDTVVATSGSGESRSSAGYSFFPVKWKVVGVADARAFGASIGDTATVTWLEDGGTTDQTGAFPLSRGGSGEYGSDFRQGLASTTGDSDSIFADNDGTILAALGCRFEDASFADIRPQVARFTNRGIGWNQFSVYQNQYKYYAQNTFHAIRSLPYSAKGWYPGATAAITSISVVSSKLQIVTSGTGGSDTDRAAVLKFLTDRMEMRYVGIRIRSVGADNLPFTLVFAHGTDDPIVGESYSSTTGTAGTWVERQFDRYDQHYPLEFYTAIELDDTLVQVAVQGLSVSSTYEIEWVRGERLDHSKLYVGADLEFITDTVATRRVTLKNVPDPLSDVLLPGVVDTGDQASSWVITDLAVAPGDQPADIYDPFTPTDTTVLAASYHQNSTAGFLPYLEGLGYRGVFLDANVAGIGNIKTLKAFPLAVFVSGYPGAGDIIGGGAYGETTTFYFDMVIRGQAFGPILGGASGQEVVLTELDIDGADVEERGRGSADADGYYTTGTPYARAQQYLGDWVRAWLDSQQPIALSGKIGDGERWWILWRTVAVESLITADTSPTGRTSYVGVQDGNIVLHHAVNWPTTSWTSINTGIAGEGACVRYGWGNHRIWLSYLSGTDIKRVYSEDGGSTWSVATTIASSATQQAFDVFSTGWLLHIWRTSGGAIQARAFDAFGTALYSAVTAVASGVADAPIAVTWDESAQRFYILYRDTGGTVLTVASADGGKTWA